MRGSALGFPGQRQWRHGKRAGGSDVSTPELPDLDFGDAGDQTQMIIRAAPRRAGCSPHANRAVFVRLRVGVLVELAAQEGLESFSCLSVVGPERGRAVALGRKARARRHDMHVFGHSSLNGRQQVGIQAELQDCRALSFPCELGVDDFVGPRAQHASYFDALEDIGPSCPAVAQKSSLHDHGRAGAHSFDRLVYPRLIYPAGSIDLDHFVSGLTQVLHVGVLVCETPIE